MRDGRHRDGDDDDDRPAAGARAPGRRAASRTRHRQHQIRRYHGTERREILPLILATAVLGGGYYGYRAVQRMDAEWEDYRWALRQYEKQQLKNNNEESPAAPQQKTVAIDLGTAFCKLAATHPALEVAVSREGDRAFFNGVVYDDAGGGVAAVSRGRAALERFYFRAADREVDVTLPFTVLAAEAASASPAVPAKRVVSDALAPALSEVLDRLDMAPTAGTTEETDDDHGKGDSGQAIRKVVTTPSAFLGNLEVYQNAFESFGGADACSFVPEPVAACWGAQFQNVLPDDQKDASSLVIDIGGWTTQAAVVRNDVVVHAATVPWGGEAVVERLVDMLKSTTEEPLQDARSLALLQMQARHAVSELSTKTRVAVHVPYIFADLSNHHLDTSVARAVLDQALNDYVRNELVEHVLPDDLSPHLPPPIDLASLWTSVLTQVLEQSATLPASIDNVLLVGGGAKSPLAQRTVGTALQMLMGGDASNKLKRPEPSALSELTVLGAATLLPSFEYSFHDGLVRRS